MTLAQLLPTSVSAGQFTPVNDMLAAIIEMDQTVRTVQSQVDTLMVKRVDSASASWSGIVERVKDLEDQMQELMQALESLERENVK